MSSERGEPVRTAIPIRIPGEVLYGIKVKDWQSIEL